MSCPICARPSDRRYRPFCSGRCADVDLAHWLRGDYAVPAIDDAPDGEAAPAPAPDGKYSA